MPHTEGAGLCNAASKSSGMDSTSAAGMGTRTTRSQGGTERDRNTTGTEDKTQGSQVINTTHTGNSDGGNQKSASRWRDGKIFTGAAINHEVNKIDKVWIDLLQIFLWFKVPDNVTDAIIDEQQYYDQLELNSLILKKVEQFVVRICSPGGTEDGFYDLWINVPFTYMKWSLVLALTSSSSIAAVVPISTCSLS